MNKPMDEVEINRIDQGQDYPQDPILAIPAPLQQHLDNIRKELIAHPGVRDEFIQAVAYEIYKGGENIYSRRKEDKPSRDHLAATIVDRILGDGS